MSPATRPVNWFNAQKFSYDNHYSKKSTQGLLLCRDDSRHRESHDPLDRRRDGDPPLHDTADAPPHGDSRFGSSDTLRDLSGEPGSDLGHGGRRGHGDSGYRDQFGRVKSPPNRADPYARGRDRDRDRDRTMEGHQYPSDVTSDRRMTHTRSGSEIPGEVTYDTYGNPKASLSGRRGVDHRGSGEDLGGPRDVDQYSDRSVPRASGGGQHLDPSSAATSGKSRRRKLDSMFRNDSLSSDPSDCVRPPPPKPHKHKKGKKVREIEPFVFF